MMRLSLRRFILGLILILGVGIGIGYTIETMQDGDIRAQMLAQREQIYDLYSEAIRNHEQMFSLDAEIRILTEEMAGVGPAMVQKQASYDLLLAKHAAIQEQLATLQISFTGLSQEYQALREDYEALKEVANGVAVEELNRLQDQIAFLEGQNSLLSIQVAQLIEQLTPAAHHAVEGRDIWGRPPFRSIAWAGRNHELRRKIEDVARTWHETHTFIEGETDCNDIAVSLWNMLLTQGIKSVIVLGNLEMVGETFEEANHTWLFVFNARGEVIYLEPTTGEVFFGRFADGSINPRAIPYREGFIYVRPSDLRRDLKGRW